MCLLSMLGACTDRFNDACPSDTVPEGKDCVRVVTAGSGGASAAGGGGKSAAGAAASGKGGMTGGFAGSAGAGFSGGAAGIAQGGSGTAGKGGSAAGGPAGNAGSAGSGQKGGAGGLGGGGLGGAGVAGTGVGGVATGGTSAGVGGVAAGGASAGASGASGATGSGGGAGGIAGGSGASGMAGSGGGAAGMAGGSAGAAGASGVVQCVWAFASAHKVVDNGGVAADGFTLRALLPIGTGTTRLVVGRQTHDSIYDLSHADAVQTYAAIDLDPGERLEGGALSGNTTVYGALTSQGASVVSIDSVGGIVRTPIVTLPASGGTGLHIVVRPDGSGGYHFGYETSLQGTGSLWHGHWTSGSAVAPMSVVGLGESWPPIDLVRLNGATALYTPSAQFLVGDGASMPYPSVAVSDPTTQFISVGQGANELFVSVDTWSGGVFGAVGGPGVGAIDYAALPYNQGTPASGPWDDGGSRVNVANASPSGGLIYWEDAHTGVVLSKTVPKPASPGPWSYVQAQLASPPHSFPAKIEVVWLESFGGNVSGAVYYDELSCE